MGALLDIVSIVILVACVWSAARRGFIKTIIGLVGTLAAVVLANKVITSARDSANNFFILHLLLFIFFRTFPAKSRIPDSINLAQA